MENNQHSSFAGDKKTGEYLLKRFEKAFVQHYTPVVGRVLETYHLSIVLFGYLAQSNVQWLWGISVAIVCQWLADIFDGAVGRHKNTGLIKWGYYMDHLLDFFFLCCIFGGYAFLIPAHLLPVFLGLFSVIALFMVNSFLEFSVTNRFDIYHFGFGPTEGRLLFILFNVFLMYGGARFAPVLLPAALVLAVVFLIILVAVSQRRIWKDDMEKKEQKSSECMKIH
jgi:phosphatidylglycerophosphate synthase